MNASDSSMEASELMGSERWRRLDLADRIASGWTQ